MHMAWERLALKLAILMPPLALLVLIGLMAIEGDYTFLTRLAVRSCSRFRLPACTTPCAEHRLRHSIDGADAASCGLVRIRDR